MNFSVEISHSGGVALARVLGELDIATTPRLRDAVVGAVEGGAGHVVVDLSSTEFIDSTACRYFVQLCKKAGNGGPKATLVCPEDNYEVWRVLDILGLVDVLGVVAEVPGA